MAALDQAQVDAVGEARISPEETAYLCEQASRYFAKPVTPDQVVWSYAGVRPLLDDESGDPSAVTRDYALELDARGAPLLSVWGGKITTFRKLAEEAGDQLAPTLARRDGRRPGPAWTARAALPGGDIVAWLGADATRPTDVEGNFARFVEALSRRHPALERGLVQRLARAYGSRAERLLASGLGAEIAPHVHEAELRHLVDREWARTADDVLWRRSKLGLHLGAGGREAVAAWMAEVDTQPAVFR